MLHTASAENLQSYILCLKKKELVAKTINKVFMYYALGKN